LSLRQDEGRFVIEVGFIPKLLARMTRFQMALDTKQFAPRGPGWATLIPKWLKRTDYPLRTL
jgi:hypothetical protein